MTADFAFQLPLLLLSLLVAAGAWLGLQLLARRCPRGSLGRALLQRARLSVSATLLLAGLGWWLVDLLDRLGWNLPREGHDVRDLVVTLGLAWTLLRCKRVLVAQGQLPDGWLSQRSSSDRLFLFDLIDKLISAGVILLTSLEVLRLLGVSPMVLLTASGIGAAAVGFGSKSLVENLLSGVMLYVYRPFHLGDQIELPDRRLAGTVRHIGIYYSELLTPECERLFVPNAIFATFAVANSSRRDHRRLVLQLTLRPEDLSRIGAITADLGQQLQENPEVAGDLPRRVHLSAIDGAGLHLALEAYVTNGEIGAFHRLRQELLLACVETIQRHGASLVFRPAPDAADPP
jgi:MscS family membrane protein